MSNKDSLAFRVAQTLIKNREYFDEWESQKDFKEKIQYSLDNNEKIILLVDQLLAINEIELVNEVISYLNKNKRSC